MHCGNPMMANTMKAQRHGARFKVLFGKDINLFLDPLFGFQVNKFSQSINLPEEKSCRDYVAETYGAGAAQFLEDLVLLDDLG